MPPKVNPSAKGQTSLFSFFNKPAAAAMDPTPDSVTKSEVGRLRSMF